jgi:hypothetical protein
VAAEHDDHRALTPSSGGDGRYDALEVARNEHVRKRLEKRVKAFVASRWRREFRGGDLVRAPLDWNCSNSGEVSFRDRRGSFDLGLRSLSSAGRGAAFTAYGLGDGK